MRTPLQDTQFKPCLPTPWRGRYATIPGKTSTFHIVWKNGRWWPALYWHIEDDELECHAVDGNTAQEIAAAVNRAKMALCHTHGGSFSISEFGEVIVPSTPDNATRMMAGKLSGKLLFDHPEFGSPIDLGECSNLQPGDPWRLPYVGMPFKLTASGEIQFQHSYGDGSTQTIYPVRHDTRLVRAMRLIRPSGGRFLVNHAGLVLTKLSEGRRGDSEPAFVGCIDRQLWFSEGTL